MYLCRNTGSVVTEFNLTGQLVLQGNTQGELHASINDLSFPDGVYLASRINGNQVVNDNVVIHKLCGEQ